MVAKGLLLSKLAVKAFTENSSSQLKHPENGSQRARIGGIPSTKKSTWVDPAGIKNT